MPLVTIYTSSGEEVNALKDILPKLREFIAKKLTCGERILKSKEISINVLVPSARLSIADVEVKIMAYSYPERVEKQDEICLAVKNFILSQRPSLGSVFVWLQLSELGHSLDE